MQLGLKSNEVRLVDYTPEWHEEFIRIKAELIKCTGLESDRIEHIGSTAIEGMSAKPIIDILVGLDDLSLVDKPLLKNFYQAGFLRLRVERPGEIVLAKFADSNYKIKTHFIHLVDYNKALWQNQIFFRDYLKTHKEVRVDYLNIKKESLKQSAKDVNAYTHLKEAFVQSIFKKRES